VEPGGHQRKALHEVCQVQRGVQQEVREEGLLVRWLHCQVFQRLSLWKLNS